MAPETEGAVAKKSLFTWMDYLWVELLECAITRKYQCRTNWQDYQNKKLEWLCDSGTCTPCRSDRIGTKCYLYFLMTAAICCVSTRLWSSQMFFNLHILVITRALTINCMDSRQDLHIISRLCRNWIFSEMKQIAWSKDTDYTHVKWILHNITIFWRIQPPHHYLLLLPT